MLSEEISLHTSTSEYFDIRILAALRIISEAIIDKCTIRPQKGNCRMPNVYQVYPY